MCRHEISKHLQTPGTLSFHTTACVTQHTSTATLPHHVASVFACKHAAACFRQRHAAICSTFVCRHPFVPRKRACGLCVEMSRRQIAASQVVEHYERPRNVGSFDKADLNVGTGLVGAPACGDVMKLQIKACPPQVHLLPFYTLRVSSSSGG